MNLIIRLLINAAALWVAAEFVPGMSLTGQVGGILVVALIFGVVNAIIRPIIRILSFPLIILTLGLFTLVINAALLGLTGAVSGNLSFTGPGAVFLGSIVVSLVSWGLSVVLTDD